MRCGLAAPLPMSSAKFILLGARRGGKSTHFDIHRRFQALSRTSLVAQMGKHLSTMQETWVPSLGQEDPLERKWQSTPVLLPGKSHGQRRLVGYSPWGRKELDTTERLHFHFHLAEMAFVVGQG